MTPVFSESRHRLSPDELDSIQDPLQNIGGPGEPILPPEGQALGLRFGNLGELDELSFPEAESGKPGTTQGTVAEIVMEPRTSDSGPDDASMDMGTKEESGGKLETGARLVNGDRSRFDQSDRG